ncbi:glycosyltransferase [Halobacteriovorax sp. JY17]|uniref:CgeB family protein n=1 Tax=Halobacteriovorax sp. JY17 TaxID=2014617 RepID=UPI000C575C33|nr:glycosyltransferase [Halobacteriovorax sp. JY17]PIK14709.1 MAG: hypothetical protein CES88_10245 [Halobacteriovorax sp. JY17]
MKILFVDIEYDYGIKSRGKNCIGQDGFKKTLENLGHEVIPFYYDKYLNNTKPLQEALLKKADQVKPDLIFFIIFRDHFEVSTLKNLKEKYTTVNWFGDDSWRFDNYTYKYAKSFSWCITTDKFSIPKYKKLGVENVFMSQWAAIDQNKLPEFTGYKYDATFVGAKHPYRKWFTDQLRKRGIDIQCFGFGWENGSLTSEQMNQMFIESKINLNLSNSNSFDLKYLLANPLNIAHTIKSKKSMSQMKARNFEINFFGGFQLTNYAPGIEDYYDIGREVACFSDLDEAEMLIKYYLSNDSLREKIKEVGHLKAKNEHGYINRLRDFFEELSR